jgi:hypothetical protein
MRDSYLSRWPASRSLANGLESDEAEAVTLDAVHQCQLPDARLRDRVMLPSPHQQAYVLNFTVEPTI